MSWGDKRIIMFRYLVRDMGLILSRGYEDMKNWGFWLILVMLIVIIY